MMKCLWKRSSAFIFYSRNLLFHLIWTIKAKQNEQPFFGKTICLLPDFVSCLNCKKNPPKNKKQNKTKNNSNNKKLFLKKGPSFLKWTLVNYYQLLAIFSDKFPHTFQFNLTNWRYKDFIYRKHPLCLAKNQFSPKSCNSGVTSKRLWTKTTSRN